VPSRKKGARVTAAALWVLEIGDMEAAAASMLRRMES